MFGIGSVAQMVLSRSKFGSFFSVNFGWGIGVTLGCYWAGGVSGMYQLCGWLCPQAVSLHAGIIYSRSTNLLISGSATCSVLKISTDDPLQFEKTAKFFPAWLLLCSSSEGIKRNQSEKPCISYILLTSSNFIKNSQLHSFSLILCFLLDHPRRCKVPSFIFGFFAGAHMNPAVTLAFAVVRRIPWRKVPVYWTAQMLGAFVASACVYAVYYGGCNANSHTIKLQLCLLLHNTFFIS